MSKWDNVFGYGLGATSGIANVTGGGGGVPIAPLPITANLRLWLDANDASTFTLNGSQVTEWRDKSGNGKHATVGAGKTAPNLVSGDRVKFNSSVSTDGLQIPSGILSGSVLRTVFVVFKDMGGGTSRAFPYLYGNTGVSFAAWGLTTRYSGGIGRLAIARGTDDFHSTASDFFGQNQWRIVTTRLSNDSSAQAAIYLDNTLLYASTTSVSGFDTSDITATLGWGTAATQYWSGEMSQHLVYDTALSVADMTTVYNDLLTRMPTS